MTKLACLLWMQWRREDGQSLVEYSLILALIAVVAMVGIVATGGGVDGLYETAKRAADAMARALGSGE